MKKLITVAFMAFLSLVSYAQDDWANFGRYEQDNREVKATPNDGLRGRLPSHRCRLCHYGAAHFASHS